MTEQPKEKLRIIVLPTQDREWVLDDGRYEAHIANINRYASTLDVAIMPPGSGVSDVPRDAFILADVDAQRLRELERATSAVRSRCMFIDRSHQRPSVGVNESVLGTVLEFGFAGAFPQGLGSPLMIGTTFVGRSEILSRCPPEVFIHNEPLASLAQDHGAAALIPVTFWKWLLEYLTQARALLDANWGVSGYPSPNSHER